MKAKVLATLLLLLVFAACRAPRYGYALISDREQHLDLYLAARGQEPINVTHDKSVDYGIAWSPDGKQVVCAKQDSKQYDLYLYDVESGATEQITKDSLNQYGPSFSPDGRSILFVSNLDSRLGEIYLMNLDSKRLTRITSNDRMDGSPTFHPNGRDIYYTSFMDKDSAGGITNSEIFVTDTSALQHVRLTNRPGNDGALDISPDGRTIACHYFLDGKADIHLMDVYGGNIRQLTSDTLDNRWPRWSPDGRYIAYTRVAGNSDIWIMDRQGKHKRPYVVSPKRDEILEFRSAPRK